MSNPQYPITELAFLNLIPPTTLQTPKLIADFLSASQAQSSWSGYPLYFFFSHKNAKGLKAEGSNEAATSGTPALTTTIYLISGWTSVQAHNEWIASPKNQELLKFFGDAGMMEVGGLAHLDIDFTKLSFEECSAIAWRKRTIKGTSDADGKSGGGNGGGDSHDLESPSASVSGTNVSQDVKVNVSGEHGITPNISNSEGREKARILWSRRGSVVDDGVEDEYELIAYSDGELGDLDEGYTVVFKWKLE